MLESPFSLLNHCVGISKIDRSDVLNCPSSSASSTTAKAFTTNTLEDLWLGRGGEGFKVKQWKITKAK